MKSRATLTLSLFAVLISGVLSAQCRPGSPCYSQQRGNNNTYYDNGYNYNNRSNLGYYDDNFNPANSRGYPHNHAGYNYDMHSQENYRDGYYLNQEWSMNDPVQSTPSHIDQGMTMDHSQNPMMRQETNDAMMRQTSDYRTIENGHPMTNPSQNSANRTIQQNGMTR